MVNLQTGQDLQVTPFPHAYTLTCAPTFCIGYNADRRDLTIQNLDDSVRSPLPVSLGFGTVVNAGGGAIYTGQLGSFPPAVVLWSPASGRVGISLAANDPNGTSGGYNQRMGSWQLDAHGASEYVALDQIN
ncbi:MAG TPA: hypothetical protein VGF84_09585, partial [Micromonosporaceae bacterium]|jgi:hypothetical protein